MFGCCTHQEIVVNCVLYVANDGFDGGQPDSNNVNSVNIVNNIEESATGLGLLGMEGAIRSICERLGENIQALKCFADEQRREIVCLTGEPRGDEEEFG